MTNQRAFGVSSLLAAALVLAPARAQDDITPKAGEPFPEIAFPTLDGGKPKTLASFRGKKVLLIQFASW